MSPFLFPPWKNPAWVSTPAFIQLQCSAMQARIQKFPPSSALPLLTHFQSGLFLEEDPDTPISPGGTHFSYDRYKMEKYYLKNCIGSIGVTTEMRHPGAKTPSSICGGKGDALVSQFSLNSLLRQCFCELENLRKVSPLLCYSRKLSHFLDSAWRHSAVREGPNQDMRICSLSKMQDSNHLFFWQRIYSRTDWLLNQDLYQKCVGFVFVLVCVFFFLRVSNGSE